MQTLKLRYAAGRFKNSFWQTYVWIDCYNQAGSRIQRFTAHENSSVPAALPAATLADAPPAKRFPAGLFPRHLSDELQGPRFGPVKNAARKKA